MSLARPSEVAQHRGSQIGGAPVSPTAPPLIEARGLRKYFERPKRLLVAAAPPLPRLSRARPVSPTTVKKWRSSAKA